MTEENRGFLSNSSRGAYSSGGSNGFQEPGNGPWNEHGSEGQMHEMTKNAYSTPEKQPFHSHGHQEQRFYDPNLLPQQNYAPNSNEFYSTLIPQGPFIVEKKKNIFKTPIGFILIFIAFIGIFLIIFFVSEVKNPEPTRPSPQPISPSTTTPAPKPKTSNSAQKLPDNINFPENPARPAIQGDYKEYSGVGEGIVNIEKPGGDDKPAYIVVDFIGANKYDSFRMRMYDKEGEFSAHISVFNQSGSSSSFIDTFGDNNTTAAEIKTEGFWRVRVYPISSTPVVQKGQKISGSSSEAFVYKGGSGTATATLNSNDGVSTTFSIEKHSPTRSEFPSEIIRERLVNTERTFDWFLQGDEMYVQVDYKGDSWSLQIQ